MDFVDLHCHWVGAIDDGARSADEGLEMLALLRQAGFATVVATPHMRTGMFDNDKAALERAFAAMRVPIDEARAAGRKLPDVHLASEHFFDDVVFTRLSKQLGVPYPSGKAALIELPPEVFPAFLQARLFDLRRAGLTAVIAHPERYRPVWKDADVLEPLLDAGAHLQLDVCALVGKYGRAAQRAAEQLLEEEAYEIAASDAHKPKDLDEVVKAITRLERLVGPEEKHRLLATAPRAIAFGG